MELVIALIFGTCVALGLALASLPSRKPVRRRLARLADGSTARVDAPDETSLLADDKGGWLARLLAPLAGKAAKGGAPSLAPTRRRLIQAGYRRDSALVVYMGGRIALALLLPLLFLAASPIWNLPDHKLIVLLGASVGLGLVAPSRFIDAKAKKRRQQIILGLPDALDLMVVCVEAGLGINASLSRVAREFARGNRVLSAEFELVTLEIRAGKSTTNALRALGERTGINEVNSLVAMLVQTERFGTSLADTLRVHADSMRVQRMQRAEEQAAKAPLKMMFPTLIIFAATLIVTIGPGLLQMFAFFGKSQ